MAMSPLLCVMLFLAMVHACSTSPSASPSVVTPSPWPLQFHSLLFINSSAGALQAVDLWYDWPNGRNFNIIHHQLKNVVHDLEWTNGTSFYYDLDAQTCTVIHFDVGILRPDWLVDNATYLGQQDIDGFTCNVWSKADFIVYYEDIETNRPVRWVFSSGMSAHVMTFEVGAVLEDRQWQAPAYCFDEQNNGHAAKPLTTTGIEKEPSRRWLNSLEASLGGVTSSSLV